MKALVGVIAVLVMFSGCSAIKGYIDPTGKKETGSYMVAGNQECVEPYTELDGSIISGVGIVTDLVTTCVSVSEENLTCPEENIFCIHKNIIK